MAEQAVPIEMLKIVGALITAWLGGYLAVEKLAEENRYAVERAAEAHRQALTKAAEDNRATMERISHENRATTERETHGELVRRFIGNPNDLNDVFRTLTLLTRTGLLRQEEESRRALIKEIEAFYGQRFDQIQLGTVIVDAIAPGKIADLPTTPTLSETTASTPVPRPSDVLVARVPLLNESNSSVRTTTIQQLLTAVRDGGIPASEQVRVLQALVRLSDDQQIRGLSATGRFNLIYVLSELPWEQRRNEWRDLATELRNNILQLEQREARGEVAIGSQTRSWLNRLKQQINP